jgi:hypothetical protein
VINFLKSIPISWYIIIILAVLLFLQRSCGGKVKCPEVKKDTVTVVTGTVVTLIQ